MRIERLLSAAIAGWVMLAGTVAFAQTAHFVFTNGKVYTVDKDNSWAEAVAVRGNEIVYVGGVEALVGDGTETIDLGGDVPAVISEGIQF